LGVGIWSCFDVNAVGRGHWLDRTGVAMSGR
jgi:hypothetical protein